MKNKTKQNKKLRIKTNKIEMKRKIQRINEAKSWSFEDVNKIDKPGSKVTKRQRECIQINKIRNEKGTKPQTPRKYNHTSKPTLGKIEISKRNEPLTKVKPKSDKQF